MILLPRLICRCRRPASDDGLRYYAVSVGDYWNTSNRNHEFRSKCMRDAFHSQMKNLGYTDSVMLNSKALVGGNAAIDAELRRGLLDKALGEYITTYSYQLVFQICNITSPAAEGLAT